MTWSQQQDLIDAIKSHGMELLAFHQTAEWNALDRFGVQKSIMITVSMTLVAAGAAAIASDSQIVVLAAMLVPVFVAALRQYTIETLDRYYARFLEAAAVQRKLRFSLRVDSEREAPFEADERLEVARRGDKKSEAGSTLWVREKLEQGHNDVVWRFSRGLCWASALLPVAAAGQLYTCQSSSMPRPILAAPMFLAVVVLASLVALSFVYARGTRNIRKKRNDDYGRLPNQPMQTDRPSASRCSARR